MGTEGSWLWHPAANGEMACRPTGEPPIPSQGKAELTFLVWGWPWSLGEEYGTVLVLMGPTVSSNFILNFV